MEPNNFQLLEKYIDNELTAAQRSEVDAMLSRDPEMKTELAAMYASAEVTRYYGISQEVAAIQQEYLAVRQATTARPATIRYIMRPALRVAASIIVLVAVFGTYKYTTLNASSVSAAYYTPYELNRERSGSTAGELENAFNNKNWQAVTQLASQASTPGSKELFLAGLAHMELNQPAEANGKFQQVIAHNQRTQSDYFQDEAEYYLVISYIKNNQAGKAIPMIRKIKADKTHLYHQKAGEISLLDLEILSWKANN